MGEASRKKNMALGVLHSQKGFSLSELLVTLILVGLITAAVAGGVGMVARSYTKVVDRADAEQLLSTVVSRITDELSYAKVPVENPDTKTVVFISGLTGLRVRISSESDGVHMYYVTGTSGDVKKDIPLIDDKLKARMTINYDKITYNDGLFTIEDINVKLTSKNDPIAKLDTDYKVARINNYEQK